MKIKSLNIALSIVFLVLFFGIFNLNVIKAKKYNDLSKKNCIRLLAEPGSRGKIFDRNGIIIVNSFLSYNAMISPVPENRVQGALEKMSGVLNINIRQLKENYRNNYKANFAPVLVVKNIDLAKAISLEELGSQFENIVVQAQPQRLYPYGKTACHILGYLGEIDSWRLNKLADYGYEIKDVVGFGGIEEKYDYYLRNEEGGTSIQVDHRGRFVRVIGFKPPKNGKDIQLTIDLRIQQVAQDSLAGQKGSIVVMDANTGEIVALASCPSFNPSVFTKRTTEAISGLFNDPDSPLINRAISAVYPAGSVFKPIVATAALETGKMNANSAFICEGKINVGHGEFACWSIHGRQNLIEAIAHSCNIWFYRTGIILGPNIIHDYALKFGLGRNSTIDLPYEASGFVPSALWKKFYRFRTWYDGDTANFAIGQGDLLVSPLQMARMIAVFANGGKLVTPYLVKSINGKNTDYYKQKFIRLPIKKESIDIVKTGLRDVVSYPDGTANVLSSLPVAVAGKTGTAQVSGKPSHAWFVGFFPYKNPKYAICVFLENGGSGYHSSLVAKQIIEMMLKEKIL